MTVSTTSNIASASGNGSTHSFSFGFKIFADGDLVVIIRSSAGVETTKTLNTHYVVTGAGAAGGGNVLFKYNTGSSSDAHYSTSDYRPASGETVVIKRVLALTQSTDYLENDPFPAADHESGLDRLTFIEQQLQESIDRKLGVSPTNSITTGEITDSASDRASKLLGFSSDGNTLQATTGRVSSVSVSTVSAGGSPTVSFTDTTGALALGIVTGATGATGSTGSTGADGIGGLAYTWSSPTPDSDPGAGAVRFNNATLSSVTAIYIDDTTAASGNPNVESWLLTWDDSTNSSDRGQVTVRKKAAQQNYAIYKISSASTDASGYVKLAVTHVDSAGSFSDTDAVLINFARTGNAGSLDDPMTTRGDVIVRNSSNAPARLAVGGANTVLKSDGTDASYAKLAVASLADGTDGELITWDASGVATTVAAGTSGHFLKSQGAGSVPVFAAAAAGGKLLQVVQATKTDTFTTTSTSFTDVTGVTVDITPAATSSKVLVILTGFVGNSSSGNANAFLSLVRGSTEIFIGDAASNRVRASTIIGPSRSANGIAYGVSIAYVDSPSSTSAVTYKAQARIGGEGTMVVGRSGDDSDADNEGRVPTSIIVMEIGA